MSTKDSDHVVVIDRKNGRLLIDGTEFPYHISEDGVTVDDYGSHSGQGGTCVVKFEVLLFASEVSIPHGEKGRVTVNHIPFSNGKHA